MIDLSLGYQTLLQPAIMVIGLVYAIYALVRYRLKGIARAGISLVAAFVFMSATVVVPFGHRGVIWSVGGINYTERQPGLSFIVPFIQSDVEVDVRQQRFLTVIESGENQGKANAFIQTSDLQEITVRASLVYHVDPSQAAELYDAVGPDYTQSVVVPIFYDAIKEAGGACEPDEQGVCQRTALSFAVELNSIALDIEDIIVPQLASRGIIVDSVALEDAVFDPAFIESVKNKVIANQKAEEENNLVAAETAKLAQAELKAQQERAIRDELDLTPEQYLIYLQLQKWNGQFPDTFFGDLNGLFGAGIVPTVDIPSLTK